MKSLLSLVFVFAVLFAGAENVTGLKKDGNNVSTESANVTISGKIVDSMSKEALAGVKISIENSDITVYTDLEGNFQFSLPQSASSNNLKVSYISYEEKTLNLSDVEKNEIEINPIF